MTPLADAGSVGAILVFIDRAIARLAQWQWNHQAKRGTMSTPESPEHDSTPVDPYAGARAMGIPAPEAPVAAPAPVTVAPAAEAGSVGTVVTDAADTAERAVSGLAARLAALVSGHQELLAEAESIAAELAKL